MTEDKQEKSTVDVIRHEAFPEHLHRVPLHPQMDEDCDYKKYEWGNEPVPMARRRGVRGINEGMDSRNQLAENASLPWPGDRRAFHSNKSPEADRINPEYTNMIQDHIPLGGYNSNPPLNSWEKKLAYHHGLFNPKTTKPTNTADEIRVAVANYGQKLHIDDPADACKYLQLEEFKCLKAQQYEVDPTRASTKCLKWFTEWTQCKWDQEKLIRGYNYIHAREARKHRPYIGTPNFQFS